MRVGIAAGLSVGLACGVGATDGGEAPVPWTVDGGFAFPADATEWSEFRTANSLNVATPNHLHLCQEASGNLVDTIGGLTLTPFGSPAYQQTVPGLTRKGVKGDAATSSQRFQSGSGPNPSTTSVAMLAWVSSGAFDASDRRVFGFGAADTISVNAALATVNRFTYRQNANITSTLVSSTYDTTPVPVMVVYDRTGSRARLFTPTEKVSPTYGVASSNTFYFLGAQSGTWANCTIVYSCGWTGAAGEISDADVKALFEALGYTIPWS